MSDVGGREVVVTGLGFISCLGIDEDTVAENLREQRTGIHPFPPFASEDIPISLVATVPEFETSSTDPEDWQYPERYHLRLEKLRTLSPHGLYATCAVRDAIENAGLSKEEVAHPRTGLYTASSGSMGGVYRHLGRMERFGPMRCSPSGLVQNVPGTLNFNLVAEFGIQGSSCGFLSACASSGHALGFAFDEIASGRQDRIIVVGAEECDVETILPFASLRVLSTQNDPRRASCPFDVKRDGFVGAGGAAAIILESAETAASREAPVRARMLGWGQATDGYHPVITHPDGAGLERAIQIAFERTALSPSEIDYVNAHATSTQHGDLAEMRALQRVFSAVDAHPAIASTKGLTGHGLSLASILESALSILAMNHGFMPGSAHLEEVDPASEGLRIVPHNVLDAPRRFLSNSSGFGGANVALIFEKTH